MDRVRAGRPGRGTAAPRSGRSRAGAPGPRRRRPSTLDLLAGAGQLAAHDDPGRPLHVAGEVGDAHAALAGLLVAARPRPPRRCTARRCRGGRGSWGARRRRRRTPARRRPPGARPGRRSPGETRIVATRSAASCTVAGCGRVDRGAGGRTAPRAGAVTTSSTRPVDAEVGLGPGREPVVARVGHRSSASASRRVAPTPSSPATASTRAVERGRRRRRPAGRSRRPAGRGRRRAGWSGR